MDLLARPNPMLDTGCKHFVIILPETGKLLESLAAMLSKNMGERDEIMKLINDFYSDLLIGFNITLACMRDTHFKEMDRRYQCRLLRMSPWVNVAALSILVSTAYKEMLEVLRTDPVFNDPFGNTNTNRYIKSEKDGCMLGPRSLNCCVDQFIPVACCMLKRVVSFQLLEVVPNDVEFTFGYL